MGHFYCFGSSTSFYSVSFPLAHVIHVGKCLEIIFITLWSYLIRLFAPSRNLHNKTTCEELTGNKNAKHSWTSQAINIKKFAWEFQMTNDKCVARFFCKEKKVWAIEFKYLRTIFAVIHNQDMMMTIKTENFRSDFWFSEKSDEFWINSRLFIKIARNVSKSLEGISSADWNLTSW